MFEQPETPRIVKRLRRRWRWQYSLRTFLLVTIVATGLTAWVLATYYREETKLPGGMVLRQQLRSQDPTGESHKLAPHGRFAALDKFGRTRVVGHYDRGEPVGTWTIYHASGRTALAGRAEVGQRAGLWRSWDKQGNRQVELAHGRPVVDRSQRGVPQTVYQPTREGDCRTWQASGQPRESGPYRGDQRHGTWTFWDEQGRKIAAGEYRGGTRHGPWTTFDPTGVPHETWYLAGREVTNVDLVVRQAAETARSGERAARFEAVYELGSLGRRAAPALLATLAGEDRELTCAALRSLARLGNEGLAALSAVQRLAGSSDPPTRRETAFALYAIDEPRRGEHFARLLALVDLDDEKACEELAPRIAQFGERAAPQFSAALASPDQATRLRALLVLGRMSSEARAWYWGSRHTSAQWDGILALLQEAALHPDPHTAATAADVNRMWERSLARPSFLPGTICWGY